MDLGSLGSTSGSTPRYGRTTLCLMLEPHHYRFILLWRLDNLPKCLQPVNSRWEQLSAGKDGFPKSQSALVAGDDREEAMTGQFWKL